MSDYHNTGSTDGSDASVKDKAADSAHAGNQAATDVAQTAAAKAQDVVGESKAQARNVVGEARDQLRSHLGDQQANAVSTLREFADQLQSMVDSGQQGPATDLVGQAAERAHGAASFLDGKSPEQLVDEVRRFARRRPGAFLAGAVLAGVMAGRLTRGVVASHQDDSSGSTPDSGRHAVAGSAGPAQVSGDPSGGYVSGYGETAGLTVGDAPAYSSSQLQPDQLGQADWEPATYVEPRAGL